MNVAQAITSILTKERVEPLFCHPMRAG